VLGWRLVQVDDQCPAEAVKNAVGALDRGEDGVVVLDRRHCRSVAVTAFASKVRAPPAVCIEAHGVRDTDIGKRILGLLAVLR
jgi:hypothetical protein